jgi:hypothetical protein
LVAGVRDARLTAVEPSPRLDASRPSPLRLAAFAATALGALLMGLGSLLTWVTIGFEDEISIRTVSPGTDLAAGLFTLIAAVIILVLLVVSRAVADTVRRIIAVVIVLLGVAATGLATWFIVSAADHSSPVDDDRLVNTLAQVTHKTVDEVRAALASVIDQLGGYTHVGLGPWIAIAGGVFAIAGGVLTLVWARRVRTGPVVIDEAGAPVA